MNLFYRIFRIGAKKPRSVGEQAQELSGKIIVAMFRRIARERNCAPTDKTSDKKIMEIYEKVGSAFRNVARSRDEIIPASNLNAIVFKFVQHYERLFQMGEPGEKFFEEHLKYEIEKYQNYGLRDDYKMQGIDFF